MKKLSVFLIAAMVLPVSTSMGSGSDADFLASFAGTWSGKGKFRITAGSSPVTVSCTFHADAGETTLSLDGKCRGMVVLSRKIGVTLAVDGPGYAGTYVGSTTGPAGLSGVRSENAFDLSIHWAKEVNGDRQAEMRVEITGTGAMRMTTIDVDPKTGKDVVTSEITLDRS